MSSAKPLLSPFERLEKLVLERGRKGLLRQELTSFGYANHQVDSALSRARQAGLITRVGQGIYAVGDARIAEVMPEVLPKLGYKILPRPQLRNYSIRRSGVTYRLDRPCRRFVMRNGIIANFETPSGNLTKLNPGKVMATGQAPSSKEIDQHFRTFQYCHSLARAEKDIVVNRVLDIYDDHSDPDVSLAIEGGTCLAQYQRLILRLSEGLDIRVLLNKGNTQKSQRDIMQKVGERLVDRVIAELPFLVPTSKGRLRKDGTVHTIIFDYAGGVTHQDVTHGIKFELVALPLIQPLTEVIRKHRSCMVVAPLEILAGKFMALSQKLPQGRDSNPDSVRHVHDIATASTHISTQMELFASMLGDSGDYSAVVLELCRLVWQDHYTSFMRRMGSLPTYEANREQLPRTHMAWTNVLTQFATICHRLELVPDEVIQRVESAVEGITQRDREGGSNS